MFHYNDVIMTTIASQITSLMVDYPTVYSDANQRKHQSSASLAFVWGIQRHRWIPRTKGQWRGKCFHLMTSSCVSVSTDSSQPPTDSSPLPTVSSRHPTYSTQPPTDSSPPPTVSSRHPTYSSQPPTDSSLPTSLLLETSVYKQNLHSPMKCLFD